MSDNDDDDIDVQRFLLQQCVDSNQQLYYLEKIWAALFKELIGIRASVTKGKLTEFLIDGRIISIGKEFPYLSVQSTDLKHIGLIDVYTGECVVCSCSNCTVAQEMTSGWAARNEVFIKNYRKTIRKRSHKRNLIDKRQGMRTKKTKKGSHQKNTRIRADRWIKPRESLKENFKRILTILAYTEYTQIFLREAAK